MEVAPIVLVIYVYDQFATWPRKLGYSFKRKCNIRRMLQDAETENLIEIILWKRQLIQTGLTENKVGVMAVVVPVGIHGLTSVDGEDRCACLQRYFSEPSRS